MFFAFLFKQNVKNAIQIYLDLYNIKVRPIIFCIVPHFQEVELLGRKFFFCFQITFCVISYFCETFQKNFPSRCRKNPKLVFFKWPLLNTNHIISSELEYHFSQPALISQSSLKFKLERYTKPHMSSV